MSTVFKQLNIDWNADPNAPVPSVTIGEHELVLAFYMNAFQFPSFKAGDVGYLRFEKCWRYRMGMVTDDLWYRGLCRFSKRAPAWGEYYEVTGDLRLSRCPNDWIEVGERSPELKHFLFYFRNEEFEADAVAWTLQVQSCRREITVERSPGIRVRSKVEG